MSSPFDLSAERRVLLERMLRAQGLRATADRAIARQPDDAPVPLSFAQQRLWFLDRLVGPHPFYNIDHSMRLAMPLKVEVLQRAVDEIVRRHETLRTSIVSVAGQPRQVIAPSGTIPVEVRDISAMPSSARDAEALRLATELTRVPFDLAAAPLARVRLVRLQADDWQLTCSMHHVVSDGWSMGNFFSELDRLYAAFERGEPSPLPGLAVRYRDYVSWQRGRLEGDRLDQLLAYWRGRLEGLSPLELASDRVRPARQSFRGAHLTFTIDPRVVESVQSLAHAERATPFMVLLTAFMCLLARWSSQSDIAVGVPVAGRSRVELEELIACFVNTLVLRAEAPPERTFRGVLGNVRESALGAYAHDELPFERLVDELAADRDLSRNPLCQVAFQLFDAASAARSVSPRESTAGSRAIEVDRGTAVWDMVFNLWEDGDRLSGRVEYAADLFHHETIGRLVRGFQALLGCALRNPDTRVADLRLLDAAERRRVLELAGEPAVVEDRGSPPFLHEMLEELARSRPGAIAVESGLEALTYGELDSRADRLAGHLQGLGVRAGDIVGICVDRRPGLLVGIFAALKAGAAFLPLDPAYPPDRLKFMLDDADVRTIVTDRATAAAVPPTAARMVDLGIAADGGTLGSAPVPVRVRPDDLAYVIYTSGSTGRPKGVLIEHGGLANVAYAQQRMIGLEASDRVLQFSSPSFDAAVFEIALAVGSGATLCLASRDDLLPGPPLFAVLRDMRVSAAVLPPSVLAGVPDEPLPGLRTIMSAGEPCPSELAVRFSPGRRFFDLYGPTETTIWATASRRLATDVVATIGRPIPNVRVYVLDSELEPMPLGVPGEICIGGAGVARGYHARPELTAQRFIADPHGGNDGRLYRTGDRGRWLENGSLEYRGRMDDQVKVRGVRVEPGEIESILRQDEDVRDCVVLQREDEGARQRLVAYIVTGRAVASADNIHDSREDLVQGLRQRLRKQVPEYMVPAAFVFLDSLPRTPNGKVDRHALRAPGSDRPAVARYAPATTPAEIALTAIFVEVLGIDEIGVDDDFFDLGGDSILSIQVVARATDAGYAITPRQIFECQTIRELAGLATSGPAPPPGVEPRSGQVVASADPEDRPFQRAGVSARDLDRLLERLDSEAEP